MEKQWVVLIKWFRLSSSQHEGGNYNQSKPASVRATKCFLLLILSGKSLTPPSLSPLPASFCHSPMWAYVCMH